MLCIKFGILISLRDFAFATQGTRRVLENLRIYEKFGKYVVLYVIKFKISIDKDFNLYDIRIYNKIGNSVYVLKGSWKSQSTQSQTFKITR